MVDIPSDVVWLVVVGFLVSFILALGVGANDVANTFGTSVGAKVLTLRQACILASIFETAGAVLLGSKVSDTIRKGIIDIEPYTNKSELLMVGNVSALAGSAIWLIIATILKLPVSASHSIVGATIGFAVVAHGAKGVQWLQLGLIVVSWFVSPVLSGVVSLILFLISKYFILDRIDPLHPGLRFLPIFYGCTIIVNVFSIFFDGPELLGFHKIPLWGIFVLTFGTGIACAMLVRTVLVPFQREKIKEDIRILRTEEAEINEANAAVNEAFEDDTTFISDGSIPIEDDVKKKYKQSNGIVSGEDQEEHLYTKLADKQDVPNAATGDKSDDIAEEIGANGVVSKISQDGDTPNENKEEDDDFLEEVDMDESRMQIEDKPEQARLFSYLQILTAIFGGFAHGGNDVSNAIGPLVSIWIVATTGDVASTVSTPLWILFYGGFGISVGLWIWGRRVIKTMGEDLTKVTPSSGFAIELGAASTVLLAAQLGLPISTTHCKVGSIVMIGRFRSKQNVDWRLFVNIILAWIITLPACIGFSAAIMALLSMAVPACDWC